MTCTRLSSSDYARLDTHLTRWPIRSCRDGLRSVIQVKGSLERLWSSPQCPVKEMNGLKKTSRNESGRALRFNALHSPMRRWEKGEKRLTTDKEAKRAGSATFEGRLRETVSFEFNRHSRSVKMLLHFAYRTTAKTQPRFFFLFCLIESDFFLLVCYRG